MPDVGLDSALPEAATWESVARRTMRTGVGDVSRAVVSVSTSMTMVRATEAWVTGGKWGGRIGWRGWWWARGAGRGVR
jgi:hypothetical protein